MNILTMIGRFCSRRLSIYSILVALACCLLLPSTAFAATTQTNGTCGASDVHCVITAGDQLITNRLSALNTLSGKVTTDQKANYISGDQASILQSDITTNQNGLNTLKSQLDGETDAKAARQDVKNIFEEFRIYAVVLPRDYRRLHLDIESTVLAKMKGEVSQLQQSINNAPSSQQGQLNTLFSNYQAQLASAESSIDTAQNNLPALTPENFNTNRSSYEGSLAGLRSAEQSTHAALHNAGSDLHQIAQLLKD